jgi:hypothetical protein
LRAVSLSERLTAALLGALFGALIGLVVAWLLGVFSATLPHFGIERQPVSFARSAAAGAGFFALVGLLFGSVAGSLVGLALHAIFKFERLYQDRQPLWVELALAAGAIAAILWANGMLPRLAG